MQIGLTVVIAWVLPFCFYVSADAIGLDISFPMYLFFVASLVLTGAFILAEGLMALKQKEPPEVPSKPYPKASALIAAYMPNEAATVIETIDSFLAMDYPNDRQIILAYNTPDPLPVEEHLDRIAAEHPNFVPVRIVGSNSKAQNVPLSAPMRPSLPPDRPADSESLRPYCRSMFLEEVSAAIREVGMAEVVPRFRRLADEDIIEKSPGDLVTIADRECERVLAARLREIRDLPVVGEEGTAADPSLLDLVATTPAAWIIDPIDGTANFVAGDPRFAVMVALVEDGVANAAWVWHPETDSMLAAQRGTGITRNGAAMQQATRSNDVRGIVKRKYMDEPARGRLAAFPTSVGELVRPRKSAGIEYGALIAGEIDFLVYWRTLPWDHAPGGLLAEEAGLRVARPDGSPYHPGDGRLGLLAATPEIWDDVAAVIQAALAD